MSGRLTVRWEVGPREPVGATNKKGEFEPRLGKNKGPLFKQSVTKVFEPRK